MTTPAMKTIQAIEAVDDLLISLRNILEALDELEMARAAIHVNDAIENLKLVRASLEQAKSQATISASAFAKIERVRNGLAIPSFGVHG